MACLRTRSSTSSTACKDCCQNHCACSKPTCFQFPHTAGVVADNLPATPAGRAEADTCGFQNDGFMSVFRQRQCGTQTAQTAADNAGFGFQTALEFRINSMRINRTKIIRRQIFLKIRANHCVCFIGYIFGRNDTGCRPYRPNRKSVEKNRLTQSCGQPALLINLLSRQPIFLAVGFCRFSVALGCLPHHPIIDDDDQCSDDADQDGCQDIHLRIETQLDLGENNLRQCG